MKLLPLVVSTTLIAVVSFIAYLYFHLGGNKNVDLKSGEFGPLKIVFTHHVGPYHKILESIEPVEKWSKEKHIACDLSFGEYLDDPDLVAEERLQSNGGCIVDIEPSGLPANFSFREVPRRFYLIAEFDGAPSIGPLKVYPSAMKWMSENHYKLGGPVIEVYSVAETKVHTRYLFPLGK